MTKRSSPHPIHITGFLTVLTYLVLAVFSWQPQWMTLGLFFTFMIGAFALYGVAFFSLRSSIDSNTHTPISSHFGFSQGQWPQSITLWDVIFWAIGFRLVGVFGFPLFEDDYFRYLWDGFQFAVQGSPYVQAPSHFFSAETATIPPVFQEVLSGINYPDIPTVYAPTLQYSFLLGYWLTPGDVLGLQIIYSIADLLLIGLLANRVNNPALVLLYAWNPLVIKEIAFTAHPDGFGALFLVAAFIFFEWKKPRWSLFFLGFAVCAKPFAWFIAPFILVRCKLKWLPVFFITTFVLYLPFLLHKGTDFAGLLAFGKDWQFNSAIYQLLLLLVDKGIAKLISVGIFLLALGGYFLHYLKQQKNTFRPDWILGGLLICSPVINAWYLLWVLPFGVIFPSRWLWVASFALLLSYVTGINTGIESLGYYEVHPWAQIAEYTLIAMALATARAYAKKHSLH